MSMYRLLVVLLFTLMLTVWGEHAEAQGRRVALVVGISAYQSAPRLPNATNDSTAMADLFRKAGFEVVTAKTDVNNLEFKRALREFEDSVSDADIAVIFYAGHGIEVRDVNYLIPSDAKLINERDVEDEAISLDRLITALEPAKRLRLIILDACRDNPFANKMQRRVATRAVTAGLTKVEPPTSDTLIAYAAKEKAVANDGDGVHSPYTTALLKHLTSPGLDIRLAFGRVRDEVMRATGRQQEPYVYGSLGGGTVALVPAPAAPVVVANAGVTYDAAKADYEIVERVGKREAWEVFLNTHKTGLYADLARVQLAKLTEGDGKVRTASVNPTVPQVPSDAKINLPVAAPPPKPSAEEQRAWDRLRSSTDTNAIRKFLERYPTSPLATAAQERLDELERLAREREEAARAQALIKQREAEERAKAAEAERERAEALVAAKRREAEERAKAAEALAKQREAEEQAKQLAKKLEAEERARAAEAAARQRQAEERARAAELDRQKAEERARAAEALAKQREVQEQSQAEAKKREAEERAKAAEAATRQREAQEQARAAEAERQKAEAQAAANQREANERSKAADALNKERESEERAKTAAKQKEAEERIKAAAKEREAAQRAKAAEAQKRATERAAAAAETRRRNVEEAKKASQAKVAQERQAVQPARPVAEARPAPRQSSGNGPATMVGIGF
jgi:hypothetical protein